MIQDSKESGRVRKPSSKYENEIVADDTADEAIKAFQKEFKRKKKVPLDAHSSASAMNPPVSSAPTTKRHKVKVSNEAKKVKSVPAPVLTAKEKILNDGEERLINAALERKTKASQAVRTLPEGAIEVADQNAAVKRAVRESCSLLLDWTTKEAMMVGSLCKVYWDGEHQWFYARILNYDSKYDRHYIYYLEDSTAEWISLQNESVLIGDRLVLAKSTPNATGWPSLHYWASPLAVPRQRYFKGYIKGATYCEYYEETGLFNWGFFAPERIQPIQEEFFPKKMTKKYEGALQKAQEEEETNDAVLETVLKAVRDNVYHALIGEQWIGLRVRASTHSIFAEGADLVSSNSSTMSDGNKHFGSRRHFAGTPVTAEAMCTGTMIHYCGVTNQHYIVFDDEGLQPQWVTAQKGVVDVLIGPGETLPPSAASEIALKTPKGLSDCAMCGLSVVNEDGSLQSSDVKHCDCCTLVCHGYCAPPFSLYQENEAAGWTCWNCNVCFGCGTSSMKTELMNWNGKRTEPELGDDRNIMLCGECMLRYKHVKDFCSICLKLYATDDSMLPFQQPVLPGGAPAPAASSSASVQVKAEVLCVEVPPSPKKSHWRTARRNAEKAEEEEKAANEANSDSIEASSEAVIVTASLEIKLESIVTDPSVDAMAMDVVSPPAVEETSAPIAATAVDPSSSVSEPPSAPPATDVPQLPPAVEEENMVQCNECARWVHAECEGIDQTQYDAMTLGTHPVWGDEYLCPLCRIKLGHLIINTLQREDSISMFANPVTTAVAKNYFDVIGNPMDLSKMKSKCAKGQYKSLQTLRQDFELMCLNAVVFNQAGDEYWQHARHFHEKVQQQFNNQARLSHISAYGFELNQLIDQYNAKVAAEVRADPGAANGKGKQKNKRGVNGESVDAGGVDKRIKIEGSTSSTSTGSNDGDGESSDTAELSESARLALLSSSMLPSAMAAVTSSDDMDAIDKENEANKLMSALDIILPTSRTPCPDPHSFMACAVMVQSSEEAFYTCCMDSCLLCGSAGSSGVFLYCVDCGEAVHSFCADAPLATMSNEVRVSWRCMNCKICETCGSATEAEESSLIYCERCDRAYHIGCLNPCMPCVPQSRWFCNECVDCTTCKERNSDEGSSADVVEKASFKSWGFEYDKCQYCTNEEEREKQRAIQAQNEAHALRVAERMKQQRQLLLNVYLCSICEVDCSDNFLLCRNCGQNSHPRCNPTSCSSWSKERAAVDFTCEHCLERLKNQPSHLGKGEVAGQLLSAVASIQRARWIQQTRVNQKRKAENLQVIVEHLSSNRYLLLAVVQWAVMRISRLEKDNIALDVIINKARERVDLNLHYWVRSRATRFYCMWRRIGNRNRTEWQTFKSNLIKGYDARGLPLDSATLARYATMASAFLAATATELEPVRCELELTPIVNEMITRFPTRKIHPEHESNPLNAIYVKIMTKPYEEAVPPASRRSESGIAIKREGDTAALSGTSSNGASAAAAPASTRDVVEGVEEHSRVMDMIVLIKSVQGLLMCGPIGLAGNLPEAFNSGIPLNVLRTNLTAEVAGEECSLVGEGYWNVSSNTSTTIIPAAADNESKVSVSAGEEDESGKVAKSNLPVYNASLGFPSTILDSLKITNSLPGNLVRTSLLYNGSRLTSSGFFGPSSPNGSSSAAAAASAANAGAAAAASSSNESSSSSSTAFFGRGDVNQAGVNNSFNAPKRKGLRGGPSETTTSSSSAAAAAVTSSADAIGVTTKAAKVNFAVAMGKHLDSVVSVSLLAGENHFAKKARFQRLTADESSDGKDLIQVFKSQDLEIYTAAEAAREQRSRMHLDAQLRKEEEQRRLQEDENRRRRESLVAAALKAVRVSSLAKELSDAANEEKEGSEVAPTDGADEAKEALQTESQPQVVEGEVTADAAIEMETESDSQPTVAVEEEEGGRAMPVTESSDLNGGTTTHSTQGSHSTEAVDITETMEVADVPEVKEPQVTEMEGEEGTNSSSTAMDCDTMSVTAGSMAETKSQKDMSVTNGSDAASGSGNNGQGSRRRSNGSSTTATVTASSSTTAAASGASAAAAPAGTRRPRMASTLWKNFVTIDRATDKSAEGLPDVVSECGVLVPREGFTYPYCMEVSKLREDPSSRCTETLPLRGWSDLTQQQQQQLQQTVWQDPRVCYLCHTQSEDHFYGRLLAFSDGVYAHANCLRWSSDVTERGGVLYDCDKARERAVLATCHYCHQKGATVSCMNRKKCGRIYHLKCAAVVNCVFLECKGSLDVSEQTEFDVHSVILCAEHAGFVLERSDRVFRKWLPQDPNRRLLLEDNLDTTVTEVSEMMSMKRGNKIVRSGALSILSIGDPRIDLPDFHTTQYLYPYHFKSARIFWSMVTPLQRTMYVFEIFSETDFEALPRAQSDFVQSSIDCYREQGGDLYDHGSTNSPVFRVLSLDNPLRPIYIKSIQQAFDLIQAAVAECNDAHRSLGSSSSFRKRQSLDAYGLNAHQFFGLGQSFVRRAIELIPESTAAMVALPPHPQYAPSFKLPTEADGRRIHRLQLAAKMTGAMSVNGCVRADGYVAGATRPMGVRITKMLTKVASDDTETEGKSNSRSKLLDPDEEPPTFAVDEEREENRREIEYNRLRYLEMSAAYLKDPNAKLEVQKSRIHGWGLFARINFERNDVIVEYIGEKVRAVIADKREAMYEDEGVGSCYLFRLDKDDIVDATKTGGMARFMNHCCEPNAYARIISSNDPSPGVPENKHIVIIAARDIQEGEEITYDYKFPIEEKKLKCYCGALKCQGSMN